MSRTVAELVNKLHSTGKTITSSRTLALRAVSEATKTAVLGEARRIAPDLNLSNVGRKGVRIGARYTIGATVAEIKATGPWQIIEYPTKAHVIASKRYTGPRKGRGERVAAGQANLRAGHRGTGRAGAAIRTPYGPRAYVRHPGTKGQHPWQHGVTRVVPQLPEVAARVYRQQIAQIFR